MRPENHEALNRLHRDEHGQTLVLVSAALMVLLFSLGLVFDVGFTLEQRRQLQNAVDAAVLAAAVSERDDSDGTESVAVAYMEANGFDTTDPALSLILNSGYAPDQIELTATLDVPTHFFRVFGVDTKTVTVRAVGEAQPVVGIADYAIVAFNESECDAFRKSGNADLEINGGGIMVNSGCSPNAGRAHGNGEINAERIDYRAGGGFAVQGSATVSPAPTSRSAIDDDPLAGLPIPVESTSPDSGGTEEAPATATLTASMTLHPGVYWGGLHLSGNATFTLEPGVYVMAGGGFTSAGNGLIEGEGVMIYLAGYPDDNDCGFVNLTGGKDLALSPPTDGDYEHITFWQDESCSDTFAYRGGHDGTTGVIYVPGATVDITGGGDLGGIQVLADTVHIGGNADYTLDFTGYVGGSGTGAILLAE